MITEYASSKNNNIKTINTTNRSNKSINRFLSTSIKKSKYQKNLFKKKLNTKINNIETQRKSNLPPIRTVQQILSDIESRKPKDVGSLFLFDKQPQKRKKIHPVNHYKHNNNEDEKYDINQIKDFNVFYVEDNEIRDLMIQFDKSNKNKLMPKKKRKRIILDKLYGISPELKNKLNYAKNNKKLNLETYQENILYSLDDEFIELSDVMDLMQSFDELKLQNSSVKPLPPINLDIIYNHVYNKNTRIKNKSMNIKNNLNINNNEDELDEFEKEQKLINNIKNYKFVPKRKINKNLEKMPHFIREVFSKQYH